MKKIKNIHIYKSGFWIFFSFSILMLTLNFTSKDEGSEFDIDSEEELMITERDVTPEFESRETRVEMRVLAIKVPDELYFAGERVPLEIFDVRERLDRELLVNTYWHSNTLQLMKLANRYFPTIEFILHQHGMPDDFKYLALVESGFRHDVSPRGAAGYWQFLAPTAKEFGLEVNDDIDERYHLEKSTVAAINYLKDAYKRFDSWTMATASYNIGMARLSRIAENQKADSYYDLFLNQETARYVFRILALKEIFNNPETYGFFLSPDDLYQPLKYETIKVETSVSNLAEFAQKHNTNYKTIKLLNPWIRGNEIKNTKGNSYFVKMPLKEEMKKADSDIYIEETD